MTDQAATTFYFRAGTAAGEVFAGSLVAATEAEALRMLRQGGYLPIRLGNMPLRDSLLSQEVSIGGGGKRLRLDDCESLCRELVILLSAGIELMEALSVLIPSLPARSRRRRFSIAVRQWLRMGSGFSQAVLRSGFTCPDDFVPIIKAGEDTGSLPAALSTLAKTYGESLHFSRIFVGALVYPAFLIVVALAVLGIIAFFVAPSLSTLFVSMDRPVPLVLDTLSAAARAIGDRPILVTVATGALTGILVVVLSRPAARSLLHHIAFALPVLGPAMIWSASRRFAVTLRLYLLSNVPLATALPGALTAAGLPGSARDASAIADEIRRGRGISAAIESHTRLPAKVVHLLSIGENSGKLPDALSAISDEASLRFEKQMALVSALLAPILIVVVGATIGSIILTVFTALLDVNDLASR